MSGQDGRAPGVVKVWLRGAPEALAAVTEILAGYDVDVMETIVTDASHRELTLLLRSQVELAALRAERDQARQALTAVQDLMGRQGGASTPAEVPGPFTPRHYPMITGSSDRCVPEEER
jgi:hypothetical protein